MSKMSKSDFENDDKWQLFSDLFVKNKGNVKATCAEHGEISESIVHRHRKDNQGFRDFLTESVSRSMDAAVNVHNARLTAAVTDGSGVDTKLLKTAEQLLKIKKVIEDKVEINTTIHAGEALAPDVMDDLADYLADKKLRERGMIERN